MPKTGRENIVQYINKDGDRWINQRELLALIEHHAEVGKLIDPRKLHEWLASYQVERPGGLSG